MFKTRDILEEIEEADLQNYLKTTRRVGRLLPPGQRSSNDEFNAGFWRLLELRRKLRLETLHGQLHLFPEELYADGDG
jgi:hypothetical protein